MLLTTSGTLFLHAREMALCSKSAKDGFGVSEVVDTASVRSPAPGHAQSEYQTCVFPSSAVDVAKNFTVVRSRVLWNCLLIELHMLMGL